MNGTCSKCSYLLAEGVTVLQCWRRDLPVEDISKCINENHCELFTVCIHCTEVIHAEHMNNDNVVTIICNGREYLVDRLISIKKNRLDVTPEPSRRCTNISCKSNPSENTQKSSK